jgi:hypothetical protein
MPPFDFNHLTLPPEVQCRMGELMRRRSDGSLSASERNELDLMIEAQALLAAIRAKAAAQFGSVPATAVHAVPSIRNGLSVVLVPPGTPAIDPNAVRRFLEEQAF